MAYDKSDLAAAQEAICKLDEIYLKDPTISLSCVAALLEEWKISGLRRGPKGWEATLAGQIDWVEIQIGYDDALSPATPTKPDP